MDKQLTQEDTRQPFEQFPALRDSIEHGANFWKKDSTWSHHLQCINDVCQQTAALQSRVVELEERLRHNWNNGDTHFNDALQAKSKIAELKRENEQNQESWEQGRNQIVTLEHHLSKAEQHAETLMGLLEREVKKNIPEMIPKEKYESIWNFYRKQHNLNP